MFSSLDEMLLVQEDVIKALDTLDAEQAKGIEDVALSMASMKPAIAAKDLELMSPEDAARLLPLIEERKRGKILDAMTDLYLIAAFILFTHRSNIRQFLNKGGPK